MQTYSSISASRNTNALKTLLKILMIGMMIFVSVGIWYHFTMIGSIPLILITTTIIPPSVYSLVQVSNYSKREILDLISPSGKRGIKGTIKTYFSHPVDVIIIPAYIATVLYMYMSIIAIELYTSITIIVVVIYAVQLLPLMAKREIYTRSAKKALNYVRDEIKITRIILFDISFNDLEKEQALNRHIAAEELMSVHSDYLICSTGLVGTFIMVVRLILPIFTGLGGQLIRPLLGG